MSGRLRVVVIGHGLIGRQRAEALVALADALPVTLVATVDPVAMGRDDVPHVAELSQLSADGWDAAIVALPHDLAGDVAIDVLERGHPVLLEKPLGVDLATADRLRAAAAVPELPSFVGYNYRFLPHVRDAFAAASGAELGRLRSIDMLLGHGGHPGSSEGWKLRPERAGGGVLIDPGVHLLDLLLRLVPDARCTHVDATRGFWDTGIEEDVIASFAADHVLATVRTSHIRWVNTFRIEIGGDDGYAILDGRGGTYGPLTLRRGRRWAWRDDPDGRGQRETEVVTEYGPENVSLVDELAAVVARWVGTAPEPGVPHPATVDEAWEVSALCESMYGALGDRTRSSA